MELHERWLERDRNSARLARAEGSLPLVPCDTTGAWIGDLTAAKWPFEAYSLTFDGSEAPPSEGCTKNCGRAKGIHNYVRFPQQTVFSNRMLPFFKAHTLP